jgi:hypothetical protein
MYRSSLRARAPLTVDQVSRLAPSAFAEAPQTDKVSGRYEFIPTTRVLDVLTKEGWFPVMATQSRSQTQEGRDFVKHMISFQNASVAKVGDAVPELILTNSHNGSSAFNIMAGLYRLVCSNGLVVCDANFGAVSIRHVGFEPSQVLEASYKVITEVPRLAESVERMRSVSLDQGERLALASAALQVKYDADKAPLTPEQLLLTRRSEDRDGTLWSTFNSIQENLVKGGLRYRSVNERGQVRRNSTREVKSVNENLRINKALWTLAEEMRKLKAG